MRKRFAIRAEKTTKFKLLRYLGVLRYCHAYCKCLLSGRTPVSAGQNSMKISLDIISRRHLATSKTDVHYEMRTNYRLIEMYGEL